MWASFWGNDSKKSGSPQAAKRRAAKAKAESSNTTASSKRPGSSSTGASKRVVTTAAASQKRQESPTKRNLEKKDVDSSGKTKNRKSMTKFLELMRKKKMKINMVLPDERARRNSLKKMILNLRRRKKEHLLGVGIIAIVIMFVIQIVLFAKLPEPSELVPEERVDPALEQKRMRYQAKLDTLRRTTSLIHPSGRTEEYHCLAWRSTRDCNPYGAKLYWLFGLFGSMDLPCDVFVPDHAGYCEIESQETGLKREVFMKSCKRPFISGETPQGPYMNCNMAVSFMNYKYEAQSYEPQPPLLAHALANEEVINNEDDEHERMRKHLLAGGGFLEHVYAALRDYAPLLHHITDRGHENRGIVLQVYGEVMSGVYAIIKLLRDVHGCKLPIELWCLKGEDDLNDPILKRILEMSDIHLRVINDPEVESYMSKPYSVAYSNFEELLFLDSDNFPLRNPEYLFDTTEFQATGAIFWKDFWSPARDEFYIRRNSVLWELLGIRTTSSVIGEMEMESGQILINRRKSEAALKILLYFSKTFKEWFEPLGLVLGDKDLFRLAWHLSETHFHYITQPPGTAGFEETPEHSHGGFRVCGLTMVQYDTEGDMLFFHRNAVKVTEEIGAVPIWEKGEEFMGYHPDLFRIDQTMGWHHLDGRMCYHPHEHSLPYFEEKDFRGTEVEWLEKTVIKLAKEAAEFAQKPAEGEKDGNGE